MRSCKNVKQLMINPERIVNVEWASRPEKTAYAVKLLAMTENRTGHDCRHHRRHL